MTLEHNLKTQPKYRAGGGYGGTGGGYGGGGGAEGVISWYLLCSQLRGTNSLLQALPPSWKVPHSPRRVILNFASFVVVVVVVVVVRKINSYCRRSEFQNS